MMGSGGSGAILTGAGAGGRAAGGSAPGGASNAAGRAGAPSNLACAPPQMACGSACVDVQSDPAHCGNCETACGADQTCAAGKCSCSGGGTPCGSACVNTASDHEHCGNCETACGTAQTCSSGTCSCSGGQTACGSACVDTLANDEHCGNCGTMCSGGQACSTGQCSCAAGQMLCSGSCVDTTTNAAHCGGCGMGCALGQTCSAGKCSGAGGVGADGCSGGLARGISVSRIDAFQTIQIGIMADGKEIAASARNTDVVEGRETLLRVFVTPGSGWAARELSARVTLVNGATSDEYFAKKTISGASDVADETSTIQVTLPPDKITADTHYYVELVECSMSAAGDAVAPRFPATLDAPLGARTTGALKITVIPLVVGSRTPAVDAATLKPYKDIMLAMYPAKSVEITGGAPLTLDGGLNWNTSLNQVQSQRSKDKPAADVYYYGFVTPADTFQSYCGGGCTAGVGFVVNQSNDSMHRVAMGIGFPVDQSYITMAHEVGHNHGRNHAPCVPQGGSISGVDGSFPYDGAKITLWGYDARSKKLINPTGDPNRNDDVTDIMGYCNKQWMSDYTYDAIVTRVAAVNGANKVVVNPDVLSLWRTLLIDDQGPRWGLPIDELAPPSGTAEAAEVLDAKGNVIKTIVVYRTEVSDIGAAQVLVPEPKPDWYAVRVTGSPAHAFAAPVTVKKP
jgi:reprolysin-like metallo-peptidase family M12B